MTKLDILKQLHFDKAHISLNPYFFGSEYEEKGVLVLMKLEEGSDLDYLDIEKAKKLFIEDRTKLVDVFKKGGLQQP